MAISTLFQNVAGDTSGRRYRSCGVTKIAIRAGAVGVENNLAGMKIAKLLAKRIETTMWKWGRRRKG